MDLALAEPLHGGDPCQRNGRRLLEAHVLWFRNQSALTDTDILGEGAQAILEGVAKYLVTHVDLLNTVPDLFDHTRDVDAQDSSLLGLEETVCQSRQEWIRSHHPVVSGVHGGCPDPQECFARAGDGAIDLGDFEDLGASVSAVDDCFHHWSSPDGSLFDHV